MAQSRERRNQRRKQQARQRPVITQASIHVSRPGTDRRRNLRRIVVAFLVLVGLAGIMTISTASEDPDGAPIELPTV